MHRVLPRAGLLGAIIALGACFDGPTRPTATADAAAGDVADAVVADASPAECPRSVCLEGTALTGCACTATVCSVDAYCCEYAWDVTCVKRAEVMCQTPCSQYLAVAMGSTYGEHESFVYEFATPTRLDEAWRSAPRRGSIPAWGDVDQDGDADLVVGAVFGHGPSLYRRGNTPSFSHVAGFDYNANNTSVALADYDNDGALDLVVADWGATSVVMRNVATADEFSVVYTTQSNANTQSVTWVDYNRDGHMDFFLSNLDVRNHLYQSDGAGSFILDTTFPTDNERSWVAAWADYDNDGDRDVMIGNEEAGNWLFENNAGAFTLRWTSSEVENTSGVAWGDFDGDDLLDVVFGGKNDAGGVVLRLMRNNGDGTFTQKWESPTPHQTWSVAVGDYDSDGDLDIAIGTVGGRDGDSAHIYRHTGSYTFLLAWSSSISTDYPQLGAGVAFGPNVVSPGSAGADAATSDGAAPGPAR